MEDLTNRWKAAREELEVTAPSADGLLLLAQKKRRKVAYYHYGNMAIFFITLMVLCYFFFSVVSMKATLSHIGIVCMIGSLSLRLMVEMVSTIKAKKINISKDLSATTQDAINFHRIRKKVHHWFTLIVVAFYIIGFYLLTPEFSKHISFLWMILMHLSFLAGAYFVYIQARIGIKKEMETLSLLTGIKKRNGGSIG